ncbi:MAG: MFS transporter [Methanomassiliicoccales archaeon]|jgi:MFS family permease
MTLKDGHGRFLLVLGAVAAFAILSSTMSKNPALPLLAEHIGANAEQVGLVAAISPIPGILVSSLAGAYSDRKGRQKILTASLLIFATAPFLYLYVTNVYELAAVRFYHGFATAVFMPVAMAAIADRYSKEVRGEKLATYSSATMAGRFVAPFLGGAFLYLANFADLYLTCAITGIIALVMSLLIPWKESHPIAVKRLPEGGVVQALASVAKDRRIMITSSMEGMQYFAMGAFEAFLPLYCLSIGFNGLEIGAVMGVQVVSMLMSKPIMGRISDRHGREPAICIGLLMGFIVIVLMPAVSNIWLLMVLSVLFGLTVATVTASTSALVCEYAGTSSHGSAIGVLSSVMDIGHSAGPLITGIVVGLVSYQAGFGLAGLVLLAGAMVFALGVWKGKPTVKDGHCEPP